MTRKLPIAPTAAVWVATEAEVNATIGNLRSVAYRLTELGWPMRANELLEMTERMKVLRKAVNKRVNEEIRRADEKGIM